MVAPSGHYGCTIVMSHPGINKAVSQRLLVFLDRYPVRFCHLIFNLCISHVLHTHPYNHLYAQESVIPIRNNNGISTECSLPQYFIKSNSLKNWWQYIEKINIRRNIRKVISSILNYIPAFIQDHFFNLDRHTWGKCLIHVPKYHHDYELQILKHSCRWSYLRVHIQALKNMWILHHKNVKLVDIWMLCLFMWICFRQKIW